MKRIGFFVSTLVLFTLVGCAPLGVKIGEEQDRGPDKPVDLSGVPDAEPRHEVRTSAGNRSPYTVLGKTYELMEDETGYREQGIASWYGQKFHGRKTSNGETYDMYAMTAAHKTLPIPCYVRVTNLENERQVIVRVNDRGPFHDRRIIDLSYAAAQRLGFAGQGTAQVEVEIIVPGEQAPVPLRDENAESTSDSEDAVAKDEPDASAFLQVGAFGSRAAAEAQQIRLSSLLDWPVVIHSNREIPVLHRVRIGPLETNQDVRSVREQLRKNDIEQTHIVHQ
ncbi:septal ring lytic transglycosylase RlpA family protein [Marinimicrobium sp. C2-29]|uniref:septal ring lytic transglycosylase RlpA family protein n=1 Tax=Marinimicrobium sp. C2-29 TaxID=3139825 RepID=UPI00313A1AED